MTRKSKGKAGALRRTHQSGLTLDDTLVQTLPHALTSDERNQLIELIDEDSSDGTTADASSGRRLTDHRRSRVRMLQSLQRPGTDYQWVRERLWETVKALNSKYKFDVNAIKELQLAYYDEDNEGFYNWHMDVGPGVMFRKISISLLLNSPYDYEGGDIEFNTGGRIQAAPRTDDALVAFPSFVLHRVTPVTRGRRYVLIAWVHGGDWR